MKSSALTDTWALSLPQQVCIAFGVLTSSPHTGTVNKLTAWNFLFILCHLYLFHYIIIFRVGISLVRLTQPQLLQIQFL